MANYKRLVLYMYEYDQDIKKGSLGYSRVESKNGQCKITIHITKTNWSNRKFQVYMFQRDPLAYGFICLGDIVLSGGTGELKIRTNQNDIMGSGNTLDNFSGILITDTSSTYIAGDWDEKGFAYRFIRQLENRDSMSKRDGDIELTENKNESMKQHPTIGAESVAKEKYSVERDIKIEVVTQNEIEKMDNSIDNVIPPVDEVLEVNETSTQKKEEESESINTVHTEDSNKSQTDIKILSDMVGEDIYKEEREEKTLSRDDWQEQFSKSLEAALTVAGWDNKRGAETNCTDEEEGILYRNMGYQENRNCRKPCRDILESAGFNPCAQNIMMKFPRIYPFEDNDICDCVRIEPQDIGLLPIEAWVLGNNSFLLHGYYSYHHLLFGKMHRPSGFVYVIGVPGVYQNRERFMAKMFGFQDFKCAKKNVEPNGEFGYWYLPIVIE